MSNIQSSSQLDSDQMQAYERDGFLIVRGVFSEAESAAWQHECDRLLALDIIDPLNVRTPFRMESGNAPERIDPVVDISPVFAELVRDERIMGAVRDLFGDHFESARYQWLHHASGSGVVAALSRRRYPIGFHSD
jgi:hypothetical protein